MKEIEIQGTNPSQVWCADCMKTLTSFDSFGLPTGRVIEKLEYDATKHERLHPTHNIEIIIYRATPAN